MPGFDHSGPMGNGPMTGGARGLCGSAARRQREESNSSISRSDPGCRRGFGGRRGDGVGRGFGVSGDPVSSGRADSQRDALEAQVRELQQSLERLQRRIDEHSSERFS